MLNIRQISLLSALVVVAVSAGTPARALTQEEQLEAAQRAYEESAKDYEEAAEGLQDYHDAAVAIRDFAVDVLSPWD